MTLKAPSLGLQGSAGAPHQAGKARTYIDRYLVGIHALLLLLLLPLFITIKTCAKMTISIFLDAPPVEYHRYL